MDYPDEAELIQRFQRGDVEAFHCLVERYHRRICDYAFSLSPDYEEAWDLTQWAFIQAWKNRCSFKSETVFITWLTRITLNLFLDTQRRKHEPPGGRNSGIS